MNKFITCIFAIIMACVVGCKSVPSDNQMYITSYAIGTATGLVANMTKLDDASRNVIVDIVNRVETCVPDTNQTFTAAWMPIAEAHVAKLVERGKIDAGQAVLITKTFNVVVNGIDYIFNIRFPKARLYQELVESAVHGFCDGLLTVFKPANVVGSPTIEYDAAAYDYLKGLN